ncbi:MAG: SurA N-terminal domain-containing protein, partial [Nocardioides sp.]
MRWPTSHKIRRFVAVLLGLGVIGSASGIAYARLTDLPDDAAFRYQGRVVTERLLDDRVQVLSALYGVQRPSSGKDAEEFDRDAAKSMAVSLVLENAATERDIVISDKTAQDQLDKLIDAQLTGGREAFVEFLSSQGISEQDVLDEIKRQMATSKLVEKVTTDVPTVADDEVRAAYQDHRDRMVTPEARLLLNIVVASRT